jgi:hypothetical protein
MGWLKDKLEARSAYYKHQEGVQQAAEEWNQAVTDEEIAAAESKFNKEAAAQDEADRRFWSWK